MPSRLRKERRSKPAPTKRELLSRSASKLLLSTGEGGSRVWRSTRRQIGLRVHDFSFCLNSDLSTRPQVRDVMLTVRIYLMVFYASALWGNFGCDVSTSMVYYFEVHDWVQSERLMACRRTKP